MENTLDLTNFYAVELLHAVFNMIDPLEQEIAKLEKRLRKYSFHAKRHFYSYYPRRLKVLIITPDAVEKNTLITMLESRNHVVDCAPDKESLFQTFAHKKNYDVVIISDHFQEIGFGFFVAYFRAGLSKRRPKLIYLGNSIPIHGFDAHLQHPFFTSDLFKILLRC